MPDLISITELRSIGKLNANVEERRVSAAIEDVHLELEKVLGRAGYALVYANAPTFSAQSPNTALYTTLYSSYIQPFMVWRAMQRAYVDMSSEADRAGVYKKTGDDYRSLDDRELSRLIAQARDRAEVRLERLMVFLDDNKTVFTWLETVEDSEERVTKQYTGGFIARRSKRQDNYRG